MFPDAWRNLRPLDGKPRDVELTQVWQAITRRRRVVGISVLACLLLSLAITMGKRPRYDSEVQLLIRSKDANAPGGLGGGSSSPDSDSWAIQTQACIIRSWPVLKEGARRAQLVAASEADVPLVVSGGKDSSIITITASGANARQAQRLAAAVTEVYLERDSEQNRATARAARLFLASQKVRYAGELVRASKALRDYQSAVGSIDLATTDQTKVKALSDLEASSAAAEAESSAARARGGVLRLRLRGTPANVVSSMSIARNPLVDRLQAQIADLNVQRASLLQDYKPTNDKVRLVEAQLQSARDEERRAIATIVTSRQVTASPTHETLLRDLVDSEAQSLAASARAKGYARSMRSIQAQLATLPERQFRLAGLTRAVQTAEKTYLALEDRYQAMRVAEASAFSSPTVVEPASLPLAPAVPNAKVNVAVGLLLGLVVGAAAALLLESQDHRIVSRRDVALATNLPVIGVVHEIANLVGGNLVTGNTLGGPAESYRCIRSGVLTAAKRRPIRTLMVTSAVRGEGKTTTAVNLAVAFAALGRTVLLVDADLRSPSAHGLFGLPNLLGLTNVLRGEVSARRAIQNVPLGRLSVIAGGAAPVNPTELIGSSRFSELLLELVEENDITIVDSPPVMGLTDASDLSTQVDAVILVVESRAIDADAVQTALSTLQQAGADVVGVVLNKADGSLDPYGAYPYPVAARTPAGRGESPTYRQSVQEEMESQ
ncbi:MAG TPA: polysaccharide biosynthesis tyrosine autokinase [Armatimonadota bacterium]|jgi:tyrosine-protein kinase Etk/Wzc